VSPSGPPCSRTHYCQTKLCFARFADPICCRPYGRPHGAHPPLALNSFSLCLADENDRRVAPPQCHRPVRSARSGRQTASADGHKGSRVAHLSRELAVPLIQIRGRSQNVERGLCPSSRSGPKDKAGTVHHYIDHDGLDFVCVQESGVRSDVCPPRLSSIFAATGHHLIVSGAHSANSFDTVAIAIHGDWKISKVFRLPASSRCLAVEIRQGSCIVFVASFLL
jgi:hypothetical protein